MDLPTYAQFPFNTVAHGHLARRIVRNAGLGLMFPFQGKLGWLVKQGPTIIEARNRAEITATHALYPEIDAVMIHTHNPEDIDLWRHLNGRPFCLAKNANAALRDYALMTAGPQFIPEVDYLPLAEVLRSNETTHDAWIHGSHTSGILHLPGVRTRPRPGSLQSQPGSH